MHKVPNRRRKKPGTATIVQKDHASGDPKAGHTERLACYIKATLEMRQRGFGYTEIAEELARRYELAVVPHFSTIAKWRREGMDAIEQDTKALAKQIRYDAFEDLEKMKSKFLRIACADQLKITRWAVSNGTKQLVLDENCLHEQLRAGKLVVEIMARQAKLMGLDVQSEAKDEQAGPTTFDAIRRWLTESIAEHGHQPQPIEVEGEVLELRSGIDEIDAQRKARVIGV